MTIPSQLTRNGAFTLVMATRIESAALHALGHILGIAILIIIAKTYDPTKIRVFDETGPILQNISYLALGIFFIVQVVTIFSYLKLLCEIRIKCGYWVFQFQVSEEPASKDVSIVTVHYKKQKLYNAAIRAEGLNPDFEEEDISLD
jgi:hypothetical protein